MTPIKDFAWVKERCECSVKQLFSILRQQVQADVKARQEMRASLVDFGAGTGYSHSFRFIDGSDNFAVLLEGQHLNERVSFALESTKIKATDTDGTLIVEGTPSLNIEGHCVLKNQSKEYPLWYFRKTALERLFFESGAEPRY